MSKRKVIITCAVTGSIHTPSMSPHLPVTAHEIAEAAIGAAEAGAAIVHLHARDPEDGRPDQSPERFCRSSKSSSSARIAWSTSPPAAPPTMTIEERLRPAALFKPEVASLNMGSMNFGLYPMLNRLREFKFDWERPYLEGSRDRIFKNTFADIETSSRPARTTARGSSIECYDIGHLYTLAHFAERGLVKPPFFVQSVSGSSAASAPIPKTSCICGARPTGCSATTIAGRFSARAAIRFAIAAQAIALGGNVRVGLEEFALDGGGKLAKSNAEQVARARQIVENLGLEIATPSEARAALQLKGGDRVAF